MKTVVLERVTSQNNYCVMKIKPLFLFTVLTFLSSFTFSQDTKTLAKNLLNKTVSIICKDADSQAISLGSGVILANDLVATNVHVIEGAKFVSIKSNIGSEVKCAGYVAIDKVNDIVILKVPELNGEAIICSSEKCEVGEQIYVAGSPSGLTGTFSNGLISGIRDINGRSLIQISAPISPGSSGGPVANKNGELIGISVGGMKEGQNLNFCIPVEYLIKLKQNISTLTIFNVSKNTQKTNSAYSGIKEGVIIRDIHYETFGDERELASISVFNNLSQPIAKVKLLFIVYDAKGIPVDSHEETLFEHSWSSDNIIKPKFGKRKEFRAWGYVKMNLTDKMTIRVLDFEIVSE